MKNKEKLTDNWKIAIQFACVLAAVTFILIVVHEFSYHPQIECKTIETIEFITVEPLQTIYLFREHNYDCEEGVGAYNLIGYLVNYKDTPKVCIEIITEEVCEIT